MKKLIFILLSLPSILLGQNILLSEDFEDNEMPASWSQTTNANDGGWLLGTNTDLQSDWFSISPHGNIIATNDDACGETPDCDKSIDYLITPVLDFSNIDNIVLQFENYFDGESLWGDTEVATVEYSLDNGANWEVLHTVVGTPDGLWDVQTFDLSDLAGNSNVLIAFHYNDDGGWLFGWAIDDVLIFEPEGLDAAITNISINPNLDISNSTAITGSIVNLGEETINSFDLSWTIGQDDYVSTFNDLSIGVLDSYDFYHPDELTLNQSGQYLLELTISNVNGSADDNSSNDYMSILLQGIEYGVLKEGGLAREYIYYHPQSAPLNCPLLFVCHGYTGTAQGIMEYSGFNQLADEYGFAVCYPQGSEDADGSTFFNVGYDFQNNETVDDVSYLKNLNSYLQNNYSLSTENVFCTGMSNGGDLSYMLACQASETFKAVAPVSGMILQDIMNTCDPEREVPIFEIHGTQDDVTYFDGDMNNNDGWGAYPSIPATIAFFRDLYALELEESGAIDDVNQDDGSTVSYEKYGSSESCSEVWLYTVNEGGHDWPGAFGNMDIDASREIWLFFQQLCAENATALPVNQLAEKQLLRVTDLLGKKTPIRKNTPMLYLYDDGTVQKKFIIE